MKSIEEKLLGQLYCFCSGGDDENGGVDFDDTVSTKVGGGATREYESVVEQVAREEGGDLSDYSYFERAQRATGDIPAALSGGDAGVARALADRAAFQQARDRASALSNDQIRSLLDEAARENIGQFGLGPRPGVSDAVPPPSDAKTVLTYDQRVLGMDPLLQEEVKRQQQQKSRSSALEDLGVGEDIDIFDTAYTGGATPAQQVQAAAGVQQARSVGSPNDIRNAERETITDFDGITLSKGPGVPKDVFEQDLTPRTKEEVEMAADRGYFNYQDLNKDGKVTDTEKFWASRAFGLVGRASDIGRRLSVGDPNAGLDYEGEAYGTPDAGRMQEDGDQQVAAPVTAPPVADPCPEGYRLNPQTNACEYVGTAFPGATQYTGEPIRQTTQYTGIGSLDPFVLQPSYTAPRSFSPLFNVG